MCSTYGGYTNFATWRINLELVEDYINELSPRDLRQWKADGESAFADHLEEMVSEVLNSELGSDLLLGYARAFVDMVDWDDIASTHLADVEEIEDEESDEEESE